MNNARILSFASSDRIVAVSSHLGLGTSSNTAIFDHTAYGAISSANKNNSSVTSNSTGSEDLDIQSRSTTGSDDGRERLDARLAAYRQQIQAELTSILYTGKPKDLLIETFSMIEQLCLASTREESKLVHFTSAALNTCVGTMFGPKIEKCLSSFRNSPGNGSGEVQMSDCDNKNNTNNTNNTGNNINGNNNTAVDNENNKDWVSAADSFSDIIDEYGKHLSLIQTLMGPVTNRKCANMFNIEGINKLAENFAAMRISNIPAIELLQLLAQNAVSYVVENLDRLKIEQSSRFRDILAGNRSYGMNLKKMHGSETSQSTMSVTSGTSAVNSKSGDQFFEQDSQYFQDLQSTGLENLSVYQKNLLCVRRFFSLVFDFGRFYDIDKLVTETIQTTVVNEFSKLQRPLSQDKITFVRRTTVNIIKVLQFLTCVGVDGNAFYAVTRSLTWQYLIQDFPEMIGPSLSDLVKEENWLILQALMDIIHNADSETGASTTAILLNAWTLYVKDQATKKLASPSGVLSLLELKSELVQICDNNFEEQRFKSAIMLGIWKALEPTDVSLRAINWLSRFCDAALKQLSKNDPVSFAAEKEVTFHTAKQIFGLIPEKNTFVEIYARDMSRRLLTSKNIDVAAEQEYVNEIIRVMGDSDSTSRLVVMIRDYSTSKLQYHNLRRAVGDSQIDFSALVLEKKYWPYVPHLKQDLIIPPMLTPLLKLFEEQYIHEDANKLRLLDWSNYALHQLALDVRFDKGTKELSLNLFQATVLMVFAEEEKLEFYDLERFTGLDRPFLTKVLYSLCSTRYPILRLLGDQVTFNRKFWDKAQKIRIPMIKEKTVSSEETKQVLTGSRTSEVQAAMVRELKQKKSLPYVVFLATFLKEFSWASISELKKNIETLVTDGYINRSADGAYLQYIA